MILPVERMDAAMRAEFPDLPDVTGAVIRRASLFSNEWPAHQLARGIWHRELVRAGVPYAVATRATIVAWLGVAQTPEMRRNAIPAPVR